tara:strand:+ start:4058 stop:4966 length:909 start_codon:yes stop_codon:yes gene_type:complete
MSLTRLNQLYAVKLGSTLFHMLQDGSVNSNVQDLIETPVGSTMPLFNSALQVRPDLPFSTHQIKSALTLLGVGGGDAGIAKLLSRKIVNKTGPAAVGSSVHATWTASASMGVINTITASNRQRAVAQIRTLFLKSGATSALVYAGTATVDAYTTAVENFVLGPILVNGTILEGTNDFSLAFNPKISEPDDDYETEPVFTAVESTQPVISFSTTDPGIWSLHNTEFLTAGGALKVNLICQKINALREADAALKHILFTGGSGRIVCESVAGTKQLTRVKCICNSPDGTVAPITATLDGALVVT